MTSKQNSQLWQNVYEITNAIFGPFNLDYFGGGR